MDPRQLSNSFDSRVRATQRGMPKTPRSPETSSGWSVLWWVVTGVLVALVLGAVVVGLVLVYG